MTTVSKSDARRPIKMRIITLVTFVFDFQRRLGDQALEPLVVRIGFVGKQEATIALFRREHVGSAIDGNGQAIVEIDRLNVTTFVARR